MPTTKRTTANSHGRNATGVVDKRSHANDAYVLKKVEQAKEFINKAGVPKSRLTH